MGFFRRSVSLGAVGLVLACGGGGATGPGYSNNGGNPPPGGGSQTLGSITLSTTQLSLSAGETRTITVTALDTQGGSINSFSPQFTSANESIAEVVSSGGLLGVHAGSTQVNVSVTLGGVTKTASASVTVTGQLPNSANIVAGPDATFQPGTVIVATGATVTWAFGSVTHTVTFSTSGGGTPQSIGDAYNTSVSRQFNTKGNYSYSCSIHYGMTGEIVVR